MFIIDIGRRRWRRSTWRGGGQLRLERAEGGRRQHPIRATVGHPENDADGIHLSAIQYRHDLARDHRLQRVSRPADSSVAGKYVFGDISSGRIFYADAAQLTNGKIGKFAEIKLKYLGRQRTLLEILGNDSRADLRFGTDAAGEIYLLTKRDGMIRRLSIAEH